MYITQQAEIKDVDLLLDAKLDIIFNSEEVIELDQRDMEKIVNCTEEEIRENIQDYKLLLKDTEIVGLYSISNYEDGKIIDMLYVLPNYRKLGIATWIIDSIVKSNFQPLYLWVYKSNNIAINLFKKRSFKIEEETKYKFYMKNYNLKVENNSIKLELFKKEVERIANTYGIKYSLSCEIKD